MDRSGESLEEVSVPSQVKINAFFESKLPDIIEALAVAMTSIEPDLKKASVRVRELHDHINYEIEKANLALARSEGEDCTKIKEWLSKLEFIISEFESDAVMSSYNFLSELFDELKETFDL